ncbi:MAG: hypothetical protein ACLSVD_06545 [Eggerthellaceae bacterium]
MGTSAWPCSPAITASRSTWPRPPPPSTPRSWDGSSIPIEERDASEVLPVAIERRRVEEPAFDVAAGLITRIVTERARSSRKLVY